MIKLCYSILVSLAMYAISLALVPHSALADNNAITMNSTKAILKYFDKSVKEGLLEGRGKGKKAEQRLYSMRRIIESAGECIKKSDNSIKKDWIEIACWYLKRAYKRCDGESKPKDFVVGKETKKLAKKIRVLRKKFGYYNIEDESAESVVGVSADELKEILIDTD